MEAAQLLLGEGSELGDFGLGLPSEASDIEAGKDRSTIWHAEGAGGWDGAGATEEWAQNLSVCDFKRFDATDNATLREV